MGASIIMRKQLSWQSATLPRSRSPVRDRSFALKNSLSAREGVFLKAWNYYHNSRLSKSRDSDFHRDCSTNKFCRLQKLSFTNAQVVELCVKQASKASVSFTIPQMREQTQSTMGIVLTKCPGGGIGRHAGLKIL